MPKKQRREDDLSSNQEYLVAFLVIGLFGLMYWFFMYGNDSEALLEGNTEIASAQVLSVDSNMDNAADGLAAKKLKQDEVQARRDAKVALDKNKAQERKILAENQRIHAEQEALGIAALDKQKEESTEKITELQQSKEKQEKINADQAARIATIAEVERMKAEEIAQKLVEAKQVAKVERLKVEATAQKLTEVEQQKEEQEVFEAYNAADLTATIEAERIKAEEIAKKLAEAERLAEEERIKAEETAAKLAEAKEQQALNEKQAALDADNAARLAANIEANRLQAAEKAEADRLKFEALQLQKEKQDELNAVKAEELAASIEAEQLKAEQIEQQLIESKKLVEQERLKAEELAEAERLKLEALKIQKEKQDELNAVKAKELAASIEAERLKAEQIKQQLIESKKLVEQERLKAEESAEAERLKLEALKIQKEQQEELNSAKTEELAASIEAERIKAEKIEQQLTDSKKLIEQERLKAETAALKIADLEKLKSEAEAQSLEQEKEREFAETERLKAEKELAEIKRQKQLEQEFALANEKSEIEAYIKLAQEALAQQEQDRLNTPLTEKEEVKTDLNGFEDNLKTSLINKTFNQPITFDKVFFLSGSAFLNNESMTQIEAAANILQSNGNNKILLRGHTDNTGEESNNVALSLSRSMNIKKMLISLGISPERVSVEGLGSQEPIADNATVPGRNENRRIDLLLLDN